jgi:SAM-dependent methyltransferase
LDVGCGQGNQALILAAACCGVTGVDPSEKLIKRFAVEAKASKVDVEPIEGRIEELPYLLGSRRFDLVRAHEVARSAINTVGASINRPNILVNQENLGLPVPECRVVARR